LASVDPNIFIIFTFVIARRHLLVAFVLGLIATLVAATVLDAADALGANVEVVSIDIEDSFGNLKSDAFGDGGDSLG
jgi:hypothetical protein